MVKAESVGALFFTLAILALLIGGGYFFYQRSRPIEPADQARSMLVEGRRLLNAGAFQEAISILDEAINLHPAQHEAYRVRGEAYYQLQDFYPAIRDLSAAINGGIDDAATHMLRGQANRRVDQFDAAIADFVTVGRMDPENREVHRASGLLALEMGRFELAEAELAEQVRRVPSDATAWRNLGWARWGLGRYEDAIDPFTQAIDADPYNFHGYLGRGATRLFMGQPAEALPDLDRATISDQQRTDYAHFFLFLARMRCGQSDPAHASLAPAEERDDRRRMSGSSTDLWTNAVRGFLRGDLTEDELLEYLIETGAAPDPGIAVEGYYYMGMMRLIGGDQAGAIELFKRTIATKRYNYYEYHGAIAELRAFGEPVPSGSADE
jgi:tetratricopeptide (TPR) repeat protein